MLSTALLVAITLPALTGPFNVGRVTVHLTDQTRLEPLLSPPTNRELMVDVWYPAESSTDPVAPYIDAATFERALGAAGFRRQFAGATDAVREGRVETHARLGAPFVRSLRRCPVIIFSPGGGMAKEQYSAQLEDLASHGYIVVAITHTYDGIVSVFPDGRTVIYDSKRWPTIPSFEGENNLNQLEWHAKDIRFVIDELVRMSQERVSPSFAQHLDLARIGAFGHSFGGMAAAHACQLDQRIRACLNQDGAEARKPFRLDARGWGMDQPFMYITRDPERLPVPDEALTEMKITRQQFERFDATLNAARDAAFERTGGGNYLVRLQTTGTSHMDFSDVPLLGARDSSDAESRTAVLALVRSYTLAFFDQTLRGKRSSLLDGGNKNELVVAVRRFPPARRR
jgi:pimeloyl-ACP methyl ester carboxylesterase